MSIGPSSVRTNPDFVVANGNYVRTVVYKVQTLKKKREPVGHTPGARRMPEVDAVAVQARAVRGDENVRTPDPLQVGPGVPQPGGVGVAEQHLPPQLQQPQHKRHLLPAHLVEPVGAAAEVARGEVVVIGGDVGVHGDPERGGEARGGVHAEGGDAHGGTVCVDALVDGAHQHVAPPQPPRVRQPVVEEVLRGSRRVE
eukprot:9495772-Pyramimonas_sp.AAC.1